MINVNKSLPEVRKILNNVNFSTKVLLSFSAKSYGDDYDPYEGNYTDAMLNPKTIKAFVTQLTPSSLVWREYGLKEQGALEILCSSRYKNWFEKCAKIKIDGKYYTIFKEAAGGRAIITDRHFNLIRVVLQQKDES